MTEKEIPVKAVKIIRMCSNCDGEMERCGDMIYASLVSGDKFPHKCNKCGHAESFDRSYPYIDYRELNVWEKLKEAW